MLKKIISLVLVVCMMATMAIAVSASSESAVSAVISEVAQDGTFTVTFYVTPNAEAELQGYTIGVNFDKTQIAVDSAWKTKSVFGELGDMADVKQYNNTSDSFVKAVWAGSAGMINSDEEKVAPDATGNIVLCVFKLKVVENEANYGNEATLTYDVDTSLLSDGNAKIANVPASGSFVMPDNRPEIAGLTATAKTDLVYTGEVIDAASTITVNTVEGDTVTYKSEPAEIKNAGSYKVTATVKRAGCKATEVSADVVVAKKAIEVKMADKAMTYGDALPEFTSDAPAGVEVTATVAANPNAGEVAITATANDTTGNYDVTVVPGKLTVAKKAITATVANATKVYGEADPAFTATATGLVGEDTLTYTYERVEGENVGKYAINATAANDNYTVAVTAGELEITKKAATIKVQDEFQVLGNGKLTTFKAPVFEGLVGNDTIEITGYEVADWADVEGDYVLTATYAANANYDVTVVPGKYSVKSAIPVVITFGENKKTYGDADGDIVVEGDVELVTIVRKEAEAAGTYTDAYEVTLKANEDPSGLPYALNVANNVFVIEPKAATITIADAAKKVEDADPAFTFVAEGFLEGEAPAEVAFSRTEGETAGEYAITATYADPNYAITVVDGKLTISKYALTVKAKDVVAYVGKEIPALTADITGAAEGDTITPAFTVKNELGEVVAIDAIDTSVEAVYTIEVASDANADKYDVTYTGATLTVRKASGRPSGGGSVIKPATKPAEDKEDAKEEDKEEDKEDAKPAASANIAIKEDAKDVNFAVADAENKFNPDVNASRNDVVAVLDALFNVTDVQNAPSFTDTEDEAIKALAAAGVINGYEDGSFQGAKDITRAEFVKLLAAALKLEAVEGAEANFSDIEGHWAAEWVKTFVAKGYIVGYPDGTFRPEANITRAEMVVVATRIAGSVAGEAAIEFADVDASHWAYDFIMKAAK